MLDFLSSILSVFHSKAKRRSLFPFKQWLRFYKARKKKEHLTEKVIVRIKTICFCINKAPALEKQDKTTQEKPI